MVDQCDRLRMYPSDRELILRSKINLGWSVHSHRVYRRLESLSDSEIDFILCVISRAQEIDLCERQRIGRLVERLENIKLNTLQNGPKSCSMCGVVFRMLGSSVFRCYDCTKCVCNKCCIDTCSVAHDPCMLCKICAEDRELWKKSGGWFYGSLPTYTKPERKISVSPSMGRTTWEHRMPEIVRLESFEPAENETQMERYLRSSWASLSTQKGGDNDDELDSLEDSEISMFDNSSSGFLKPVDDNLTRKTSLQYLAAPEMNLNLLQMSSMSTSCPSLAPPQMTRKISLPHPSSGTLEFSLAYNSKSNVLQCTIYCVKGLAAKTKDEEMTYVKVYTIPFSKKMNTVRTKSVGKDNTVEFNETLVFSKIRQEKLKKRVLRLQVLDDDPFDEKIIGEVGVDLSDLKSVQSKIFTLPLKESHSEIQNVASCGWILMSLRYSPEDHALVLGIICCSDLVPSNKTGQLDSFVKAKLLPELSDVKCESAVKHKTLNPTFNENFTFHLSPFEMKSKSLKVSVHEKTGKNNKCIGYVTLGIQARGEMLQHWLEALQKPKISVEKWHALLKETKYIL